MQAEKRESARVLVIGYGNPAREDDGLGPGLVSELNKLDWPGLTVESNYQLVVEDAVPVSQHEVVVFADAQVSGQAPFSFDRIFPAERPVGFSHEAEPGVVLRLAQELSGRETEAYLLGIRGYSFQMFREEMTEAASRNLKAALDFLQSWLKERALLPAGETSRPAA